MDKICIVGLGYVGLPLAVEFGNVRSTIGFDINSERINELKAGFDRTFEVSEKKLENSEKLSLTSDINDIKNANIYIITVPTPIDRSKNPDLTPLINASKLVGGFLEKDNIVIYESTVYPGATEEVCVPILEASSYLKYNIDFYCGYSPERINPGDKVHTLTKIVKVTSGSTPEIAAKIDKIYGDIIKAGTHLAPSIKVAEAAKVIENSQRDINIAFVNELALIFEKIGIDTNDVLEAAGTKWNFLNFKPGLVGGHCIGVDPYYLTHKAESLGYHPQVILSGRRINDNMGIYVANQIVKLLVKNGHSVKDSKVLVLGITFKENCPDIRNSKVVDIIFELESFNIKVDVFDPHADKKEVKDEYNLDLIEQPNIKYSAIVLAVAHKEFITFNFDELKNKNSIIYDLKGIWNKNTVDKRL